jgi:hypothetical protein
MFVCGWLAGTSPLPDEMRPDKSELILLPANFRWRGVAVDVAVAVGPRPDSDALAWLKQFCLTHRRPLIYQSDDEWFAFGPPLFQHEIAAQLSAGKAPWAGGDADA